ncbi:hypothetical protein HHL23_06340 [Chryseobacterium sp. RP-3-3]|uniref:Uncharacterized protein n=1 Tax=Chryseobacterium antibioticum TaxID=2728847 RepID=A0A7Y0AL79_9FLAO|nr:hypothetical protein [Chryseobacterium antibioticum]NML69412.1 hypothetical protein [Chryseobacterium antibioticum]
MKKKYEFDYLLNQDKEQVVKLVGEEFNFYPSLETGSFWRKTVMFIFFDNEIVFKTEIKIMYEKLRSKL